MSINVFEDVGLSNPGEHLLKAQIALQLSRIIKSKELSQVRAAELTGLTQPQISNIRNGKLRDISVEKLLRAVNGLDRNVQIVIGTDDVASRTATTSVTCG